MRRKDHGTNIKKLKFHTSKRTSRHREIYEDKLSEYFLELSKPGNEQDHDIFNYIQDRKIFD